MSLTNQNTISSNTKDDPFVQNENNFFYLILFKLCFLKFGVGFANQKC